MRERGAREEQKMNTASDWIFNLMLWSAIVTLFVLIVNMYTPILGTAVILIAIAFVVVVSALWPKW
jgi:Flp pilus assembly protein TadB